MEMQTQLIIVNVGVVAFAVLLFLYLTFKDRLKRTGQDTIRQTRKINNRYVRYTNNIFLRKRFRHIVQYFATMECYDFDEVKKRSVKLFEQAILRSVAMPVLCLLLIQDVILTLLMCFIAYIYYNMTIDKEVDALYASILRELSNAIQSIREQYMQTDNIARSVLLCDKGELLTKPLNTIYEILAEADGSEKLYNFSRSSPVRMIKTLANTCFIYDECGDEKKSDGSSAFAEVLIELRQEVDAEVQRLERIRIAFKSLPVVALIGISVVPLIDMYLLSQIPGTALLLKGVYGGIIKCIIIGTTALAYYVISVMNRPSVVNQEDKIESVEHISEIACVKRFVKTILPKKYKTRSALEGLMTASLSSKNLEYVYTLKVLVSTICFVTTLVILCTFVITAKSFLWGNINSLDFIPNPAIKAETEKQIRVFDLEYMTAKEKMSDEDAVRLAKGKIRGVTELDYMRQAERVSKKWDAYYGMKIQWYFLIIAYLAGLIGWFAPEWSLKFRRALVEFEASEDVLQLQTMMIVLSSTKMDVMKALYWLEKQSSIHKAPLRYAYHEFTSDPDLALDRLALASHNLDFKRLVSKLKAAVYALSLSESFSDMKLDRANSLALRKMWQEEALESKKQWAKLIASAPVALVLIFEFIFPILYLGISSLAKTYEQLGTLPGM